MVLGVEGLAGGVPDQLSGKVSAPVDVNLLTKPLQKGLVISLIEPVLKVGQIPMVSFPKLGSGEVAQGIGGEVAKAAQGPVDILEAALSIVGNLQAEKFLK